MPNESKAQSNKKWNLFQNISKVLLPCTILIFTIVFGVMEWRNQEVMKQLTTSNIELIKSKVRVSLLPSLSSQDASKRIMALELAKEMDEQFAVKITTILAKRDSEKTVRLNARQLLESLSMSEDNKIRQIAEKGIEQADIMTEMRNMGLLRKLNDAHEYIDGGAPNGDKEALKLYHEVIAQLSPNFIEKLDKNLLSEARNAEKEGFIDQAVRKYRALFADYRQIGLQDLFYK